MMWMLMWLNRSIATINTRFQFLHILVVNSCDAREQLLNEFQEKKKKPLFLSQSSKQKCMKFKKKKLILKEIAQFFFFESQNFIS